MLIKTLRRIMWLPFLSDRKLDILTGSFDTDQLKNTANNFKFIQWMCSTIFTPTVIHKSDTLTGRTFCSAPKLETLSSYIVNHFCDHLTFFNFERFLQY